jgi:choline dehydrogenase-like flavoprotein
MRAATGPVWHANGTVRMGKQEIDACVSPSFHVYGVERLRVADMSVVPLTLKYNPSTIYPAY